MVPIHFQTVMGPDQVIRPPEGLTLPEGPVEVVVPSNDSVVLEDETKSQGTRDWLLSLATEAEHLSPPLPSDLAERHNFYAHGKRRLL
jgi:hypothetical protein